jgi:hypothetical protein
VIEGEVVIRVAILADEAIAQEDVEPGEGGMRGRLDERLSATPRSEAGFRRLGLRTARS